MIPKDFTINDILVSKSEGMLQATNYIVKFVNEIIDGSVGPENLSDKDKLDFIKSYLEKSKETWEQNLNWTKGLKEEYDK